MNYFDELMDYDNFKEAVLETIQSYLPEEFEEAKVEIKQVLRVNEKKDGLIILPDGATISPTIYLEEWYSDYLHGFNYETSSFDNVLKDIVKKYISAVDNAPSFPDFKDENIKEGFYCCLANYDMSKEMLQSAPHERFLDLAVYVRLQAWDSEDNIGSIIINNEVAEFMGMSPAEVLSTAKGNMKNLFPHTLMPIGQVLSGMDVNHEDDLMYVLTNDMKTNGAYYMTDSTLLSQVADVLDSNLVILPSSTHEVLIIPDPDNNLDYDNLQEMVRDINETTVLPKERLSNNVYHFDARKRELSIASEEIKKEKEIRSDRKRPNSPKRDRRR